jgi:hypothetical protein
MLWVVGTVLLYFQLYLDALPPSPGLGYFYLVLVVTLLIATSIAVVLLRAGRSRVLLNRASWTGVAYPQEDPGDDVRLADRKEVAARHDLKHGRITRAHYERIVAQRQFVHGDITRAQYHERIREISEEEQRVAQSSRPTDARSR